MMIRPRCDRLLFGSFWPGWARLHWGGRLPQGDVMLMMVMVMKVVMVVMKVVMVTRVMMMVFRLGETASLKVMAHKLAMCSTQLCSLFSLFVFVFVDDILFYKKHISIYPYPASLLLTSARGYCLHFLSLSLINLNKQTNKHDDDELHTRCEDHFALWAPSL